jgi:DNA-binding NtrC family response regulator
LLESELLGHERGAFTGATTAKAGLIESAHGGTLFLDEIGEMQPATQAKVLGVLENREVRRVGSLQSTMVDVRFVAATNRDLLALVAQNQFRADLYYRLNGVAIRLPPLRARVGEIADLAKQFLEDAIAENEKALRPTLSAAALRAMTDYDLPGNVRELGNVIDRAVLLCEGDIIQVEHLQIPTSSVAGAGLAHELEQIERDRIVAALEKTNGNQTAARLLGMARRTLVNRLATYDLRRRRA